MGVPSRWAGFVDVLSFSAEVRNLVDTLNQEIASAGRSAPRLPSHPAGFVKEITKRRLTMAEAYLRLVTFTGIDDYRERLDALQTLIHQAWHSKTLLMPVNTARVQAALMKECVKASGDKRRQLELMSDFALASHGQQNVIHRLLREHDMIEVPEDGRPLSEMDLGWDDHVHDFLTEGRKTPCQLLLDAFIKGISRLTVAYYDLHDARVFEEALEAGRLLGIQVEIGIEFSVGKSTERLHFMFIPPGSTSATELEEFLEARKETLRPFFDGLDRNSDSRRRTISTLLESFNNTHLKDLNARFRHLPFLMVQPLHWLDVERLIQHHQASRIHLGQVLWQQIQPVLHKRVLYLKNQYLHARDKLNNGSTSTWEVDQLRTRYLEVRAEYETCSARGLLDRYMPSREGVDYDSAFATLEESLGLLSGCGGRIVFIHPLSQGPQTAVDTLVGAHPWLTDVETFNLADSQSRDPADLRRLSSLIGRLNAGKAQEVMTLLSDWGISARSEDVAAACESFHKRPLLPRCGSDYDGRDARVPGMGFIKDSRLPRRSLLHWQKQPHQSLSANIGQLLLQRGDASRTLEDGQKILVLERPQAVIRNRVGDEAPSLGFGPIRWWRYLNLNLKSLAKIAFAFVPAFFLTSAIFPANSEYAIGLGYVLLWFGITGLRNVMADLVAAAGLSARSWRLEIVDRDNLANSIFWTGFSVPVLGAVKLAFDGAWPQVGEDTFLRVLAKFCVLALANGLYLSTHNKLRGFDAAVVRANFFRTVLSWPLATAGSYALNLLSIPSIVQAKIWSDVVAGVIEGTGKARRRLRLCRRDYFELFRSLLQGDRQAQMIAVADILFVWARRHKGRSTLQRILQQSAQVAASSNDLQDAGKRLNPAQIRKAVEILRGIMLAEGSMEGLTSLILEHYCGREAVVLSSLVADHHLAFRRWVRRYAPAPATPTDKPA